MFMVQKYKVDYERPKVHIFTLLYCVEYLICNYALMVSSFIAFLCVKETLTEVKIKEN